MIWNMTAVLNGKVTAGCDCISTAFDLLDLEIYMCLFKSVQIISELIHLICSFTAYSSGQQSPDTLLIRQRCSSHKFPSFSTQFTPLKVRDIYLSAN